MDVELSDEQRSLQRTVRRFLSERAPVSYVRSLLGDPRGTSEEVWRGLAQLGMTGVLVPEPYGGLGLGMVDMGLVLEEMGRVVHPGPFLSSAVGATAAILEVGEEEDRCAYLPPMAAGETVAALALLEPDAGYEWRRPGARAERRGSSWRVSGTKTAVLDPCADLLLVTAWSDGGGMGLFALEGRDATVSLAPSVDGTRTQGLVALREAPARRIGEGDAGPGLEAAVDRLLLGLVADALGAAEAAMRTAVEYAKTRVQFDRPIGSFQAVKHLCADMFRDVELGRSAVSYGLWCADAAPAGERHRAAALAKAFASEAFPRVTANAIQVLGGIGFTWEHDAHLYYRRCLSMRHTLGGAAEHYEELASVVVGAGDDGR